MSELKKLMMVEHLSNSYTFKTQIYNKFLAYKYVVGCFHYYHILN